MKKIQNLIALNLAFFLPFFLLHAQVAKLELEKKWAFRQGGTTAWMDATVPGCVHTDLLDNKIIPDPYYRANEKALQWVGEKDWEYKTAFSVPPSLIQKQHLELVFKGLDTYADVYLNDQLVLTANNMHREWRVDCKQLLKTGENTLRVYFKSVFKVDVPKYLDAPFKAQAFPNNDQGDMWLSLYARKAGYEYGWDWGPRLITSGIWRPVFVEGWDNEKLENVQVVQQQVTAEKASLSAVFTIVSDGQPGATVTVSHQNKVLAKKQVDLVKGTNKIQLDYDIARPKLWWCNGLGEPNLYNFEFSVDKAGTTLDHLPVTVGLRSLKIIREKDKDGTSFYVKLNGVPVFIKGSNYIPIDNFLNRVTPGRYDTVINTAKDANMNMLRVWGGGIYENDIFYDLCDKKGILVWQDMMFACGMFPADKAFVENVKQEIKENIIRLRNHPSIALWCGNNENEIAWFQWGWKAKYAEAVQKEYEQDMHQLFNVEIPATIYEVDSTRFYHPSSPSTGFNGIKGKDGDAHYYSVWSGGQPFEAYNNNVSRFMSEYGFQSLPEYRSIERFTLPEDRSLVSPVLFVHQKAKTELTREDFGNKNIENYMERYFKKPKDFPSFLYLGQVLQAKGIVTAIEAHRRHMPFCMGTMYWQLNDCWPVASWSSTDYYGRWKALHYAVKKAYQPEMISVMKEQGKFKVYIVTDNLKDQKAMLRLQLSDFGGKVLSLAEKEIVLHANSSQVYFEIDTATLLKGSTAKDLVWKIDLKTQSSQLANKAFYFVDEKDMQLPEPNLHISLRKSGDKYFVDVQADKLAKNVFLSMPQKDGFFTDNYFDLMPGEMKTVGLIVANDIRIEAKDLTNISLVDSFDR